MFFPKFIFFYTLFLLISVSASGSELHLALADSTCAAMKNAGNIFSAKTNITLQYTCKSSGLLVKGIKADIIEADYFLSANKRWMDEMVNSGLIDKAHVQTILSNDLIIVSSAASPISLSSLEELTAPKVARIIIGDPSKAPFGRYTKQALENAGIWMQIRKKISTRKKISLAIKSLKEEFNDKGTVGILYRTGLDKDLRFLLTIPKELNDPINYYAAPLKASVSKEGIADFLSFQKEQQFQKVFQDAGFIVLP